LKESWDLDRDPLAALRRGDARLFEAFVLSETRTFLSFFLRLGASQAEEPGAPESRPSVNHAPGGAFQGLMRVDRSIPRRPARGIYPLLILPWTATPWHFPWGSFARGDTARAPIAESPRGAEGGGLSLLQELAAQEAPEPGETIVTASRRPEPAFEAPFATAAVPEERIAERAYRTLPQALRDVPGVMIQETSPGQGSPYIRGFTGFRTLMLIDGFRLNDSVFREGPNQYWNTVDAAGVERLEVVKGPSSVLYGSDAIGGTVNAMTRSVDWDEPNPVSATLDYRYATAEHSDMARAEVQARLGDSGFLAAASVKDIGDIEGGEDAGTLENTHYEELGGDLKAEHWLGDRTRLVLAYQGVVQDDVPRTHSTQFAESFEGTTVGTDLRRDLDQDRDLTYLRLEGSDHASWYDEYSLGLSWHEQEETETRVRSNGAKSRAGFDVGTLGAQAQFTKALGVGEVTAGVEGYRDDVDSESTSNPIQGPVADDATYDLVGIYAEDRFAATERLDLILGARFNYAEVDAEEVADPVTGLPFEVEDDWSAVVGSARFVYQLAPEAWNLFGGLSQGFRAPNLSDLTRFDNARTNEFEIPAPDLDSEEYLTFELGVRHRGRALTSEASFFYTDIEDMIVRFPTGNTNALGEFEITRDNVGDGWAYGIELGAAWRFLPEWTLFGDAAFLEGKADTFPTSAPVIDDEWLDRLMPLSVRAGLRWERRATWAEALAIAAADADRLSTRDEADTQRIPPGGTPGYTVLHLGAGHELNQHVRLRGGVDNVFDEDYRIHGSGSNMPGRNLIVGATLSF
jgi:hemoglobin/transferrin/lactoferrin receptor protein